MKRNDFKRQLLFFKIFLPSFDTFYLMFNSAWFWAAQKLKISLISAKKYGWLKIEIKINYILVLAFGRYNNFHAFVDEQFKIISGKHVKDLKITKVYVWSDSFIEKLVCSRALDWLVDSSELTYYYYINLTTHPHHLSSAWSFKS